MVPRKWIEITLGSALHSLRCEMNRPAFYIDRDVEDSNYMERVAIVKPSEVPRLLDDNYMECVALMKPSRLSAFHYNNYKLISVTVIRLHRAQQQCLRSHCSTVVPNGGSRSNSGAQILHYEF
jgi:hypothetical protein